MTPDAKYVSVLGSAVLRAYIDVEFGISCSQQVKSTKSVWMW